MGVYVPNLLTFAVFMGERPVLSIAHLEKRTGCEK